MRIIENVTLYRCDFCKKQSHLKGVITRHEKWCKNNPNNKHACFDCALLEVTREAFDKGDGYGYNAKVFTCKKLDQRMFTYKAERRKFNTTYSNFDDTIRMPLECKDFKSEWLTIVEDNPLFSHD